MEIEARSNGNIAALTIRTRVFTSELLSRAGRPIHSEQEHQLRRQRPDGGDARPLAGIGNVSQGRLEESPRKQVHAVVNAGTGEARTFKAVAESLMQVHGPGRIDYIPFPGDLKNRYQHYTQADVSGLRAAGYTAPFTTLEDGVKQTFAEEPAS